MWGCALSLPCAPALGVCFPRVCGPSQTCSPLGGMLDKAVNPLGWMRVMLNVAFMAGSSKHGKDFRASVDCICVVASTLPEAGVRGCASLMPVPLWVCGAGAVGCCWVCRDGVHRCCLA